MAIQLWDAGAIGVLEIPQILREWRQPSHPEFTQSGKTAWRLFNAATEIIKGDLWRLPRRTRAVHLVMNEAFGVKDKNGTMEHGYNTTEVVA